MNWGGSLIRPEATGYGMFILRLKCWLPAMKHWKAKNALISGSGNVAQFTTEKLFNLGAKVLTFSDSSGYIYDEQGIDDGKLEFVKSLKNIRRGRIEEYVDKYSEYTSVEHNSAIDYQSAVGPQGGLCFSLCHAK